MDSDDAQPRMSKEGGREEHLQELRGLIGKVPEAGADAEMIRRLGAFVEGTSRLTPYLGTRYIGCASGETIPLLFALVRALRMAGSLLLVREAEKLDKADYPGSAWATILWSHESRESLEGVIRKRTGIWLRKVTDGVFLIVIEEPDKVLGLASEIQDRLQVRPRSEESPVGSS